MDRNKFEEVVNSVLDHYNLKKDKRDLLKIELMFFSKEWGSLNIRQVQSNCHKYIVKNKK